MVSARGGCLWGLSATNPLELVERMVAGFASHKASIPAIRRTTHPKSTYRSLLGALVCWTTVRGIVDASVISASLATLLAAIQLLPQVLKLRRDRTTAGLSPTWALLGVSINVGWVSYRWSQELWLSIPSPVIAAGLYLATLMMIDDLEPRMQWGRFVAIALLGVLSGAGAAGGSLAVGTVLALSSGAQAAPLLWRAFRSRELGGVAPTVWMIGLTQACLWGHYGWWHTDVALMVYAATTAVVAVAMLARYAHVRRAVPAGA
jgi:uncharacterized protein with PQ loop repeat